jgi:hypothetical protein
VTACLKGLCDGSGVVILRDTESGSSSQEPCPCRDAKEPPTLSPLEAAWAEADAALLDFQDAHRARLAAQDAEEVARVRAFDAKMRARAMGPRPVKRAT